MARNKKKKLEERKLILNDIIELFDKNATSVCKRIEFFNSITIPVAEDIVFAEDDKNKLTRSFLQCDTADVCGIDSNILKKREFLYTRFKKMLPDYSLSDIFKADIKLHPNDEIFNIYTKEKSRYDFVLISFLDKLYSSMEYELFMRWILFLSCFPTDETNDTYNYIHRITAKIGDILKDDIKPRLNDALDHFIMQCFKVDSRLKVVNIVANHGLKWLSRKGRYFVLKEIIEKAEHINILITEHNISEYVTKHTREPKEIYDSEFIPSTDKWIRFCSNHRDKITLKISHVPAMRQYVEFQFEDDDLSAIFSAFYAYGGMPFNDMLFMIFKKGDLYFDLFRNEFQYLLQLDASSENKFNENKFLSAADNEISEKFNNLNAVDRQIVIDIINRLAGQ